MSIPVRPPADVYPAARTAVIGLALPCAPVIGRPPIDEGGSTIPFHPLPPAAAVPGGRAAAVGGGRLALLA